MSELTREIFEEEAERDRAARVAAKRRWRALGAEVHPGEPGRGGNAGRVEGGVKPDETARSSGSAFGAVVAAAQGRETANGLTASQAQLLSRFAAALQADRLRHPSPPPPQQQQPQQQQQLSPHQLSRTCTELRIDTAIERARSARARREARRPATLTLPLPLP